MMVDCICINDSKRPAEIMPQTWISKGVQYKIVHVYYYYKQGIQGVRLYEVNPKCFPEFEGRYDSYALTRFAFTHENFLKLIELMKLCTELDDVQINEVLRETELEILK